MEKRETAQSGRIDEEDRVARQEAAHEAMVDRARMRELEGE